MLARRCGMLLQKNLISGFSSDWSLPLSFFEGKKCFLFIHWVWKTVIFLCLLITDIVNYKPHGFIKCHYCYQAVAITDGGPRSVLQVSDQLGYFSGGLWFPWMVCCVKLHKLLWFVTFACFFFVSQLFFALHLFVKGILCWVILMTISWIEAYEHLTVWHTMEVCMVSVFYLLLCIF